MFRCYYVSWRIRRILFFRKTTFLRRVFNSPGRYLREIPQRLIWCGRYPPFDLPSNIQTVKIKLGTPEKLITTVEKVLGDEKIPTLLCIDDLQHKLSTDGPASVEIGSVLAHHLNATILLSLQILYADCRIIRSLVKQSSR